MLGVIFRKSQSKIQDPAKLRRLVELINGETWLAWTWMSKERSTRVCWRRMPRM